MKIQLSNIALGILVLLTTTLHAQTQLYDFSFNNSYSSTIGTGTFASNAGTSFTTDRHGNANGAINLNGLGTTATLTGLPYAGAARSISLWAKVNAFDPNYNFLYSYGTSANPDGVFIKPLEVRHFVPNHSTTVNHVGPGVWFHYVIIYDGTSSKIYKDGVLVSSSNITKNTANNSNLFRLGLTESGGTNYFNGAIDDLKIYSGVLTAQQINTLYLDGCKNPNPVNTTPTTNLTICEGASTTLTVSGNNVYWFGDSTSTTELGTGNSFITSVLSTTTHYYAQTIDSSQGCLSSDRIAITINVIPAGTLTTPIIISDTSIVYCTGATITLVASGSNNGTLQWYDAPTVGNLLATGDTFTTPTLSTDITYYVEDFNTCSTPNSSTRTAVLVKVGGSFSITNTTPAHLLNICNGNTTTLTLNTTADTIVWSLNNNQIGTGASIVTSPISVNTTFIATATKQGVCTANFPVDVTVYGSGTATNTTPSNSPLCPGDSITLSATASNGAPLYWMAANGPSTVQLGIADSIRVAVNNTGIYYVRAGSTGAGCASALTLIQVNVTTTPIGTISLSSNNITSTNLFDSYVLKQNGITVAQSSSSGNIAYNNAPCGDYQAFYSNTVNSCATEIYLLMRRVNASTGCDHIYITHSSGLTFPATIQVRKGGGAFTAPVQMSQTGQNTFNNVCTVIGGTNNLEVRIVGQNGCIYLFNQATTSITTSSTPTTKFASNIGGDTLTTCTIISNIITIPLVAPTNTTSMSNRTICAGQATTLTATGTGTLKWYNVATGGTELGTGNSFNTGVLTSTTNFYVEAESGACISNRTLVAVTVNPLPQATIIQNGSVLSTQTFNAYQWQLGGVDISNATSQTYNAIQNGNYTVLVTDANGCQNVSNTVNVTTVGVHNLQSDEVYFKIYPNPTKNLLNIEVNEIVNIRIVNVLGATIAIQKLYEGNNVVDVSNLASGIYFISNERGEIARFVKE